MDAKDYNRAEWVRLEWIEDLKGLREQAAALGAYDGDDRMLKALYKVFDGWEALMKDGYKTLIKMRLDGLRGTPKNRHSSRRIIPSWCVSSITLMMRARSSSMLTVSVTTTMMTTTRINRR